MNSDDKKVLKSEPEEATSGDGKVVDLQRDKSSAAAGLETIQDILFGEQLRAGNAQLDDLKRESESSLKTVAERFDQRLTEMEETIGAQLEALSRKLDDQASNHKSAEQRIDRDIGSAKMALTQSIDSTRANLTKEMNRILGELDGNKLDSGKLSDMFTQVARELSSVTAKSD